jgi:hypothetical protein
MSDSLDRGVRPGSWASPGNPTLRWVVLCPLAKDTSLGATGSRRRVRTRGLDHAEPPARRDHGPTRERSKSRAQHGCGLAHESVGASPAAWMRRVQLAERGEDGQIWFTEQGGEQARATLCAGDRHRVPHPDLQQSVEASTSGMRVFRRAHGGPGVGGGHAKWWSKTPGRRPGTRPQTTRSVIGP